MKKIDRALDYSEREVQAVLKVLNELGQVLGAYRKKFVIVGGAVPWLLFPNAKPKHIGTLDIDLDLNPEALSDGEYAHLVEALEDNGYQRDVPGLKPFQLKRSVKIDDATPVDVIIDLLVPREAKLEKNRPQIVSGLRVQGADGGALALAHAILHKIEGTMPDGRRNEVELLVASIPAWLVMKGYALVGRNKMKDAYDIYFSIRNYDGGPVALAKACSELLQDHVAKTGYEHIASKFRSADDFGPMTVRAFLESQAFDELTPEQIQTDAFMKVVAFLRELELFK